jgi:GT2 family glycosyltransferase
VTGASNPPPPPQDSRTLFERTPATAGHQFVRGTASGDGDPPIAAAVVSFNTQRHLARCLASLVSQPFAEILVVDNASTDGSPAFVAERYPAVRLLANQVNTGYGAAANQALRAARAPFVLLLNADTEVLPASAAILARHLDARPRAAIAAPALVGPQGDAQISVFPFPGTSGWLLENEPLAALVRRVPALRNRSVSFRVTRDPRPVPWAIGAALMMRREAVLAVNGFDESYFMYYEEVDLCWRLARAGYQTLYVPDATIVHVGGASTEQQNRVMSIQRHQSAIDYYHRHLTGWRRVLWPAVLRIGWAVHLAVAAVRRLVARDPSTRRHHGEQQAARWAAIRARPGRK